MIFIFIINAIAFTMQLLHYLGVRGCSPYCRCNSISSTLYKQKVYPYSLGATTFLFFSRSNSLSPFTRSNSFSSFTRSNSFSSFTRSNSLSSPSPGATACLPFLRSNCPFPFWMSQFFLPFSSGRIKDLFILGK